MPKVALTERQKDFQRLANNLEMLRGGRSAKEMAALLGSKSPSTYYARLEKPEKLTYEEIKRLCDMTRVDMQNFVCGTLKIW